MIAYCQCPSGQLRPCKTRMIPRAAPGETQVLFTCPLCQNRSTAIVTATLGEVEQPRAPHVLCGRIRCLDCGRVRPGARRPKVFLVGLPVEAIVEWHWARFLTQGIRQWRSLRHWLRALGQKSVLAQNLAARWR